MLALGGGRFPPVKTDPRDTAYRIGQEIRRIRRSRDLSQDALAQRADLHMKHFGEIERGRKASVQLDTLLKIADALETPLWMILEAADAAQRASGPPARS